MASFRALAVVCLVLVLSDTCLAISRPIEAMHASRQARRSAALVEVKARAKLEPITITALALGGAVLVQSVVNFYLERKLRQMQLNLQNGVEIVLDAHTLKVRSLLTAVAADQGHMGTLMQEVLDLIADEQLAAKKEEQKVLRGVNAVREAVMAQMEQDADAAHLVDEHEIDQERDLEAKPMTSYQRKKFAEMHNSLDVIDAALTESGEPKKGKLWSRFEMMKQTMGGVKKVVSLTNTASGGEIAEALAHALDGAVESTATAAVTVSLSLVGIVMSAISLIKGAWTTYKSLKTLAAENEHAEFLLGEAAKDGLFTTCDLMAQFAHSRAAQLKEFKAFIAGIDGGKYVDNPKVKAVEDRMAQSAWALYDLFEQPVQITSTEADELKAKVDGLEKLSSSAKDKFKTFVQSATEAKQCASLRPTTEEMSNANKPIRNIVSFHEDDVDYDNKHSVVMKWLSKPERKFTEVKQDDVSDRWKMPKYHLLVSKNPPENSEYRGTFIGGRVVNVFVGDLSNMFLVSASTGLSGGELDDEQRTSYVFNEVVRGNWALTNVPHLKIHSGNKVGGALSPQFVTNHGVVKTGLFYVAARGGAAKITELKFASIEKRPGPNCFASELPAFLSANTFEALGRKLKRLRDLFTAGKDSKSPVLWSCKQSVIVNEQTLEAPHLELQPLSWKFDKTKVEEVLGPKGPKKPVQGQAALQPAQQ